jgi:heme A synthase
VDHTQLFFFFVSIEKVNNYFKITLTEGAIVLSTKSGAPCKEHWLDENRKQNKS